MAITADVKSGQCKACGQGGATNVPVLEMGNAIGMRVWEMTICRKCAAEMRRHLDEFINPKDD
jgi:hypothetical protein